ncbi:MAG TPA: GtrA family protein, partial [Solirubrobacterales bacterium]|nr:GtrA family protein [Solirubrobacterales bacterium]
MSDGQNTLAVRLAGAARSRDSWLQLLKFGVVGGSGYLINLGVFAFLSGNLGVFHDVAAVGAFCVAVTSNFLWNRYWTFGPGEGLAHMQAARFLAVSIACLVINLVVLE